MTARRAPLVLVAALVLIAVPGCDGDDGSSAGTAGSEKPAITVSAGASLRAALTDYGKSFDGANARFSFAGSDELAAQIRKGVRPDVFAAANTKLPEDLYAEGLVEKPVVFAGNRLVIAVPTGSDIDSLDDLGEAGQEAGDRRRRRAGRRLHAEGPRPAAGGRGEGDRRRT